MAKKEAETNSEVNDKASGDVKVNRKKRSHVPTEEEMYFHKLAYDRIPDVDTRSDETVKLMKEGAPWNVEKDESDTKRSTIKADSDDNHRDYFSVYGTCLLFVYLFQCNYQLYKI